MWPSWWAAMVRCCMRHASWRVTIFRWWGINQGRLGFMTDIARSGMLDAMTLLMEGRFKLEERLLLDTEVVFGGASSSWQPLANLAFNDVVIDKGATGRMIEFELSVDDEFIYSARADGLIICTRLVQRLMPCRPMARSCIRS